MAQLGGSSSPKGLLEREAELAALLGALDAARAGAGSLVVVEGAAGLGKSALLAAAVEQADELGLPALASRGNELEREFPFGIVRQLFEQRLSVASEGERQQLFTGAAGLAASLFARRGDVKAPTPPADPGYATLHGLYWLLANLSLAEPLVLAIDDAHWADTASLRWLAFLLPRVHELSVALLVSFRTGDPGAESAPLAMLSAHGETIRLHPRPLSRSATAQLVAAALGSEPDAAFVAACDEATAGNPFFLHALLAELADVGCAPSSQHAERVRRMGPRTVSRSVLLRLSVLDPEAPAMARAVAVLGDGAGLRDAAELAGVPEGRARRIADLLSAAAVLKRSTTLEFVHPIVREAVYADLRPHERTALHGQAARVLAAGGADPERAAAQLLSSEPSGDPWVVDRLREAARSAATKGAAEEAVRYLRRALAEPPEDRLRPPLLLELGTSGAAAAEPDALGHLQVAFDCGHDPEVQARAAFELGRALLYAGRPVDAVGVLVRAIDRLRDAGPDVLAPLEALLLMQVQTTTAARRLVLPRLRATIRDKEPAELSPSVLATSAIETAIATGPASEAADVARRALQEGGLLEQLSSESPAVYFATCALTLGDRADLAEHHLAGALAAARSGGAVRGFVFSSCFRAWTRHRCGALSSAEADVDAFLGIAVELSLDIVLPFGLGVLVAVRLERTGPEEADAALQSVDAQRWDPDSDLYQELRAARARLRLAQQRPGEALRDTQAIACWEREWGAAHDAWTHWRSLAVRALMALGRQTEAEVLAARAVELARTFGARDYLGLSLRTAALVASPARRQELLEEAVLVLEPSQARLEHAYALTDLGATLRRADRRADGRARLTAGLELARACGATRLAARAVTELEAAGAHPRPSVSAGVDALTPSERRIAEMAAAGSSNPQIAQALFVSLKTVETHLGHAYGKLGIHSRTELPAVLQPSS